MARATGGRLLDALDRVLNSNAFLLEDTLGEAVRDDADAIGALTAFLRSARFRALLWQADQERGWGNYARQAHRAGVVGEPGRVPAVGERLYADGVAVQVREIDERELREDLVSLLTTAKSPHRKQLPPEDARAVVDEFLQELRPEPADGSAVGGWRYFRVAPNFLRSSGYAGPPGAGGGDPTYFDGGPFDRCFAMLRGRALGVLLTNGAP